jgi:hypothetical protein
MNGYLCFYAGKRVELQAENVYSAQQKAVAYFQPPKSKRHMVHVHLCEKDGEQVTHSTSSIG